jgi:hypothetical protein
MITIVIINYTLRHNPVKPKLVLIIFKNSASTAKENTAHKVKVKQSLYTPWRRLGGEEV